MHKNTAFFSTTPAHPDICIYESWYFTHK